MDTAGSPASSLPKANSVLRSPGHATEGTIGAEGWWHHMDHSHCNEPPTDEKKSESKAAGFVPQYGITGQSRSLWADEPGAAPAPAPAAAPAAAPAPAPAAAVATASIDPSPPSAPAPSPTCEAAPAIEAAPAPLAAASTGPALGGDSSTTIQNAGTTGWWAHMDNSILNQPAEAAPLAPGAVRVGERVMGGGFVPQFGIAGGNRYGSIFDSETEPKPEDAKPLKVEEQMAKWSPFDQGQGCAKASTAAAGDDDWSGFTSAPKVA